MRDMRRVLSMPPVSIPFIAGQWSLRLRFCPPRRRRAGFQSPSLRGSGRFEVIVIAATALVAAFQSPSLRGSGRFAWKVRASPSKTNNVSIPFIAGQWSLLVIAATALVAAAAFQSPSLRGSGRFLEALARNRAQEAKFQSPSLRGSGRFRGARRAHPPTSPRFQSPSLRGSGRFETGGLRVARVEERFNPLHCGAVVASLRLDESLEFDQKVSIPFIAGQWSLRHVATEYGADYVMFQSPSLRGSGRFTLPRH